MNESYTRSDVASEYIKALSKKGRIMAADTRAELLAQIVGELAMLNCTLGKIERAMTGGADE